MGKRRDNIQGQRFGRLTAVECIGYSEDCHNTMWKCQCDCGNITVVSLSNLKTHHSTSCGCLLSEIWRNPDKRVERAKTSPKTGRFETNMHAKSYVIETNHDVYEIRNMSLFIREHPTLFGISAGDEQATQRVHKYLSEIKNKNKE